MVIRMIPICICKKKKILRRVNVRSAKKRFCLSEKKRENMEKLRRSGVSIPSAGW